MTILDYGMQLWKKTLGKIYYSTKDQCLLLKFLTRTLQPNHVTFFVTSTSDITQAAVMDKVMSASGSKSHVK